MWCGLPKAHKNNYIDNGVSRVAGNVHQDVLIPVAGAFLLRSDLWKVLPCYGRVTTALSTYSTETDVS